MKDMQTIAEKIYLILPNLLPNLLTVTDKRETHKELDGKEMEQLAGLLTGRLVFLLRFMDENRSPRFPNGYGRVISAYVDVSETKPNVTHSPRVEEGWKKASQYACWYLSALGLVKQCGEIGYEVEISDLGKKFIRSNIIRQNFELAFVQQLPR
jgi:hypothetical protein